MQRFLSILLLLAATGFIAHTAFAAEATLNLDSSIPAGDASFSDAVLWVRVWEYDPKLSDAGAKNVADTEVEECSHRMGVGSMFSATVMTDLKEGMGYYVTSEIFPNGEKKRGDRLYFTDGFNIVFGGGGDDNQLIELRSAK